MPLPIGPVLGILSDNLKKRGSVLPLSKSKAIGWSKGLSINSSISRFSWLSPHPKR